MTDPGAQPSARGGRSARKPLSGTALVVASAVVVVLTAVVVLVLWWLATKGLTDNELVSARFDALRIGLSIGVGSGGVIVLYLAWRRQQALEDTLAHQERVAESTEEDARERRITDLYTKAADQLGSDKAAVRLAGLYALERLAQDHPPQRHTIVNVLCAYLRMPFDLPSDSPPRPASSVADLSRLDSDNGGHGTIEVEDDRTRQQYRDLLAEYREQVQEREVRHTAQRLLVTHSRPGSGGMENPDDTYWPNLELDLTGATLDAPDFRNCHVATISLKNARIGGRGLFFGAKFGGDASFDGTEFGRSAVFDGAKFGGDAVFERAKFGGHASFGETEFGGRAVFDVTKFGNDVLFDGAKFGRHAVFNGAEFRSDASFGGTEFGRYVVFDGAEFIRDTSFFGAKFGNDASFDSAKFGRLAVFSGAKFGRYVVCNGAEFANGMPRELAARQMADTGGPSADDLPSGNGDDAIRDSSA